MARVVSKIYIISCNESSWLGSPQAVIHTIVPAGAGDIYRYPNILSICSLNIFVWIHNTILRQVSRIPRSQQRWKTYRII